jgi:hypothetical protein
MGEKINRVNRGVSMLGKVLTSALWAAAGVVGAVGGKPIVLLPVALYLAYLWLLGGRWLIY